MIEQIVYCVAVVWIPAMMLFKFVVGIFMWTCFVGGLLMLLRDRLVWVWTALQRIARRRDG